MAEGARVRRDAVDRAGTGGVKPCTGACKWGTAWCRHSADSKEIGFEGTKTLCWACAGCHGLAGVARLLVVMPSDTREGPGFALQRSLTPTRPAGLRIDGNSDIDLATSS